MKNFSDQPPIEEDFPEEPAGSQKQ